MKGHDLHDLMLLHKQMYLLHNARLPQLCRI